MSEAAWLPTLHTPPLSQEFVTDGTRLLKVIDLAWRSPENEQFELDEWQRWLIEHVLERYPDDHPRYPGELRYKEVVISMGRQNGKSVLGAIFGLYGLLVHVPGPEVISVASSREQAQIIYDRVKYVVANNPALTKRYKVSSTRGLKSRIDEKPGSYLVKAGKEEALQGVTISLCLFDEIHICKPATWTAVSFGTTARADGMVLGITTAGDSNSDLLKRLYERGRKAAVDPEEDERFGFFLWEAPEHLAVDDPEALIAANPAIASGRIDIDQEITKVRNMPENEARRYRLNQFVSSEANWLPQSKWIALDKGALPHMKDVVWAVDRTENWGAATITASVKDGNNIYTRVAVSVPNPDIDWLEDICVALNKEHGGTFVMEQAVLYDLSARLRARGIKTEYLTQRQIMNASATAYSLIHEGRLVHGDDALLRAQVPRGVAKNSGEGWRVSRKDSVGDVDALLSTIMGAYYAEVQKPNGPLLFVA